MYEVTLRKDTPPEIRRLIRRYEQSRDRMTDWIFRGCIGAEIMLVLAELICVIHFCT